MKILIFGDSNTWGYDPLTGDRQSERFVTILQKKHPEWTIVDNGQNGRLFFSFHPFFRDIDGSKQIERFLRQQAPYDLVLILLGSNDARRMMHRTLASWLEAFSRFKAIVIQANQAIAQQTHTPLAPIVFVPPCLVPPKEKVWDLEALESAFGESGLAILQQSEQAMKQDTKEKNVRILPRPSFFGGEVDGIHFGLLEHQAMAVFLEAAIQEIILSKEDKR